MDICIRLRFFTLYLFHSYYSLTSKCSSICKTNPIYLMITSSARFFFSVVEFFLLKRFFFLFLCAFIVCCYLEEKLIGLYCCLMSEYERNNIDIEIICVNKILIKYLDQ